MTICSKTNVLSFLPSLYPGLIQGASSSGSGARLRLVVDPEILGVPDTNILREAIYQK